MHNKLHNILYRIHNSEKYSEESKAAWRDLFQLAKVEVQRNKIRTKYNKQMVTRDTDELAVQIVVDDWLAQSPDFYTQHSHPDDDAHAGDMSCLRAFEQQRQAFLTDLAVAYQTAMSQGHTKRASRIEKLWKTECAQPIREVTIENYDAYGDDAWDEIVEPIDDTQAYVNRQEYREDFIQAPECDPDDSRFTGTPPRSDSWDDKMRSDYCDRGRGSGGVLQGLYTNSYPEPNYRDRDQRRRLRFSYLDSDNSIDIEMGSWIKRMDSVRRKRLVNRRLDVAKLSNEIQLLSN